MTSAIGSTGVEIPRIVFGTSSLGNLYSLVDDATKLAIVGEMLEHVPGTVALDSAGKYGAGLALESLGRALSHFDVPRERVIISNKLGWRRVPLEGDEPTFEPGVWCGLEHDAVQDISYDGVLRCWDEGNQLLGDYDADLLSVHDPDEYLAASDGTADEEARWADVLGAYRALGELRASGKARAIGVGSKDWRVIERLVDACELDWVMLATSFTIYHHESEVIEFIESLRRRDIAVINSAVFHGGFLTGGEFFNYRPVDPKTAQGSKLIDWRDRFWRVCEKFDVSPAEACVAFGISSAGVVAIALNTSRPEKVSRNARLAETRVDPEFWRVLTTEGLIRQDALDSTS